jgi:triosephosphate isomerase
MAKSLIVANWKSNKTVDEALSWLREFNKELQIENLELEKIEVVVCPSFIVLEPLKLSIINSQLPIKLGAQDISPFPDGPYTGEISAKMLSGLVDYILVGHSERRKHFGETTGMINQKVQMAQKVGIVPIVCMGDFEEIPGIVKEGRGLCIMYEPPAAISQKGVYHSEPPERAQHILATWKSKAKDGSNRFLYGGSVNPKNVKSFLACEDIDGVVVGYASLSPQTFLKIVKNAKI